MTLILQFDLGLCCIFVLLCICGVQILNKVIGEVKERHNDLVLSIYALDFDLNCQHLILLKKGIASTAHSKYQNKFTTH